LEDNGCHYPVAAQLKRIYKPKNFHKATALKEIQIARQEPSKI